MLVTPHSPPTPRHASSSRDPIPRPQASGSTVSGPKTARLPQREMNAEPTSSPFRDALKERMCGACSRLRTISDPGANASGSERPYCVPNASRKTLSAAGRSSRSSGAMLIAECPSVAATVPPG